VLLALVAASLWAEVDLDSHINDFLDNTQSVESFFNQYGNESTLYNEAMQNRSLEALQEELMEQSPSPDPQLQEVENLFFANELLGSVFEGIDQEVGPIDLDDVTDNADEFEAIRHWVVIGYLILVAVVLFLLVLAILCGVCIKNPAFLIIMVVVLVILTLTMWVAAGASLAFLVVSGDICSDPDTLIRNFTRDQSDAVSPNVVNYYLICNETCQPSPFSTLILQADDAFARIAMEEEDLQNYTSHSANQSLLQPLLDDVVRGFNGSRMAVNDISSCVFIHDLYIDSLQTFCGDSFDSSVIQFGLVCGLCVGLMVLVVTATFHAGFFCNNKKPLYDEEAIAYDLSPSAGVWSSYGTNVNYNSSYTRFREQPQSPQSTQSPPGASEPPKYNDLQQPITGDQPSSHFNELREIPHSNGSRLPSGGYDPAYNS
jgi:hypothetical protein